MLLDIHASSPCPVLLSGQPPPPLPFLQTDAPPRPPLSFPVFPVYAFLSLLSLSQPPPPFPSSRCFHPPAATPFPPPPTFPQLSHTPYSFHHMLTPPPGPPFFAFPLTKDATPDCRSWHSGSGPARAACMTSCTRTPQPSLREWNRSGISAMNRLSRFVLLSCSASHNFTLPSGRVDGHNAWLVCRSVVCTHEIARVEQNLLASNWPLQ